MLDDYQDFIEKVNERHDIDLSLYKQKQMKRRITTLRDKRGFSSYVGYFEAMEKDPQMTKEFIDRLTINVSEFFRNKKRWDVLRDRILPDLTENKSRLSVWSAACSTGEEPYTLAILLKEHFPHIQVDILATDIDDTALTNAKAGKYMEQSLKEMPNEFKEKYFTKEHELYVVDPSLKRDITFKKHNLLGNRYPSHIDLIVCRNVLIYFTDEAKKQIYHGFNDSLREGGVLFVGSTEQIFTPEEYGLQLIETFFYQKSKA